jgi:hypothetical protein
MSKSHWIRFIILSAAGCFAAYAIGTAVAFYPGFSVLSGAEQFSVVKHMVVVLALAGFLVYKPKIGSVAAVAWGLVVPFEKYLMIFSDLSSGNFLHSEVFAPSDTLRLSILFLGTCLSAVVAAICNIFQAKLIQGH